MLLFALRKSVPEGFKMTLFIRISVIIAIVLSMTAIFACERPGDDGWEEPVYKTHWTTYANVTEFDLTAVWGASETDVWAAGNDLNNNEYAIYHFDGDTWEEKKSGDKARLNTLWGNEADDVFAAGSDLVLRYDGALWSQMECTWERKFNVEDLWGFAGDSVYGVGWDTFEGYERALIFHYDGQTWEVQEMSELIEEKYGSWLLGLWGNAPDNIYTVGEAIDGASIILHYDGENWGRVDYPKPDTTFQAVWGPDGQDLVIAGWGAEIYMKDGSEWSTEQIAINKKLRNYVRLYDVTGFSSNEIYAAGMIVEDYEYKSYLIVRYNGEDWTQIRGGPKYERVNAMWGDSDAGLYFVGNEGLILHYKKKENK